MKNYTKEDLLKKLNETFPFCNFTFGEMDELDRIHILLNNYDIGLVWSKEMDSDLQSYGNIEPEKELEDVVLTATSYNLICKILATKTINTSFVRGICDNFDEEPITKSEEK